MTEDLFRNRLDNLIDLRHPLAVLTRRIDWQRIDQRLAPIFAHRNRVGTQVTEKDLFGAHDTLRGAGVSNAGRPRLPIRLMVSLLYLKHLYNLSDEALVEQWAENVYMQYFSGMEHFTASFPCDATQVGRFRTAIGEAGAEELLRVSIETAQQVGVLKKSDCQGVIVDSTVQEKAVAHPTDSRLLEQARSVLVNRARWVGIACKQTFVKESKRLTRQASGYAHARQFKRLRRVIKRQRTIVGILLREIQRKAEVLPQQVRDQVTQGV